MPAFGDIKTSSLFSGTTFTDSATIGVDRTLSPMGYVSPGIAKWVDRAGGIPVGYPSLTMQVRPPSQASRNYKVSVKLALPTLEQTSPSTASGIQPAPTKAYDCSAILEFILPERSTFAERAVLINNLLHLLSNTVNASDNVPTDNTGSPIRNAVLNFEPPY